MLLDRGAPRAFPVSSLYFNQSKFPVEAAFSRILSSFIRSYIQTGPLSLLPAEIPLEESNAQSLHRVLLAYYRLLQANRPLPDSLCWPIAPLFQLIWGAHFDMGVRFLAIRCYVLQSGMMEAARLEMEKKAVGDVAEVDCNIEFATALDGTPVEVDGWIMPALEVKRVTDARNAHLEHQNYYTYDQEDSQEPMHPSELRLVGVYCTPVMITDLP